MVIDTTIFIEYLRSKNKKNTQLYQIPENIQIFISSITLYELFMATPEKLKDIENLVLDIPILSFNEDVARKAGEIYHQLRKQNKIIKFRDIFIAATYIAYNQPIKTSNVKHFERIKELKIQNSY